MKEILIVDYGLGNVLSVKRALEYCGAKVIISSNMAEIEKTDYLVLPGVGAFKDGMEKLSRLGLKESIIKHCALDKPFLGICLGMQMLMDIGYEHGENQGLGVLKGKVEAINWLDENNNRLKTPNIGWRKVFSLEEKLQNSILKNIKIEDSFYFVHSYVTVPKDEKVILARSRYGIESFCAAIKSGNIYGFQFHPEKSREAGLEIFSNWIKL